MLGFGFQGGSDVGFTAGEKSSQQGKPLTKSSRGEVEDIYVQTPAGTVRRRRMRGVGWGIIAAACGPWHGPRYLGMSGVRSFFFTPPAIPLATAAAP